MKTLVVYLKDGFYKFEEAFMRHTYGFEDGYLYIYRRARDGEESVAAIFRDWTYVVFEQD